MLTVSGNIGLKNSEDSAQLDLKLLQSFKQTTIRTTTVWTEGVQTFTGVELAELTEQLGLQGTTIRASALNDYTVSIPMTDAVENGPIVAYARNGETMSVRNKGPLWVIYPYDDEANYRSDVIYSRSIWQLDRLEAVD